MQRSTRSTSSVMGLVLATAALFLMALTSYTAAQGGGQAPAPAAGAPAKPLVPVAASTVAANPDAYVGEFVTLTGAVEANISNTSFSVDQDKTKATGKDVLVVAPYMQSAAEANTYVTAIGQLIKFDEAEIAKVLKEYKLDLSPTASRPGTTRRHRTDHAQASALRRCPRTSRRVPQCAGGATGASRAVPRGCRRRPPGARRS